MTTAATRTIVTVTATATATAITMTSVTGAMAVVAEARLLEHLRLRGARGEQGGSP